MACENAEAIGLFSAQIYYVFYFFCFDLEQMDILQRARRYCAFQERSQQELRDKLYEWGMHRAEVEQSIAAMIEEGYLNEERFAMAYAGGKFRIKQWGRVKIKLALKQKKVSDYCIRKALAQFTDAEYEKALHKVLDAYGKKFSERNPVRRNYRLAQYAMSRGFEHELVWEVLMGE